MRSRREESQEVCSRREESQGVRSRREESQGVRSRRGESQGVHSRIVSGGAFSSRRVLGGCIVVGRYYLCGNVLLQPSNIDDVFQRFASSVVLQTVKSFL